MFIQRVDLGKHVHPSIFDGTQNCVRARIHSLIEFAKYFSSMRAETWI